MSIDINFSSIVRSKIERRNVIFEIPKYFIVGILVDDVEFIFNTLFEDDLLSINIEDENSCGCGDELVILWYFVVAILFDDGTVDL